MQSLGMTAERRATVTETINAYSKRLMGFIRRRVKSDADAEDVLQDVFQQLVGHSEPIEQVAAWLFRVARNKITDGIRKKKPEALEDIFGSDDAELGLDWTELFPQEGVNPETEYLRALFWEELATALTELPAEQREVFIDALKLRFRQNMHRHAGVDWVDVHGRLHSSSDKLRSLHEMERTGGEPDVIGGADDGGAYRS